MLKDNDIDIIGLCETRLDDKIKDSEVSIPGYQIYRNDPDSKGGGVAIYVKETIPQPNVKLLCLKVAPKHGKSFFVVCWYRPPTSGVDTPAFNQLRDILKNLDLSEKEIILIGDTNCDLKATGNSNAENLKLIYSEFQLEQLVNSYTRVAVTHSNDNDLNVTKSLIDHFSTNKPNYILKTDILETGMVDHFMIYGIRKVNASRITSRSNQKIAETRSLKTYNRDLFQRDLQEINWEEILGPLVTEPCRMAKTFQETFETLLNLHAPLKVKKVRSEFAPWLTSSVRILMLKRDKMKKAASRNPQPWPNYKRLRNQCTNAIRSAIREHYHGLISPVIYK